MYSITTQNYCRFGETLKLGKKSGATLIGIVYQTLKGEDHKTLCGIRGGPYFDKIKRVLIYTLLNIYDHKSVYPVNIYWGCTCTKHSA